MSLLLLISTASIHAYTDVSENYDESLTQGIEYTYTEQRKILFVQIQNRYDQLALSPEEFLNTAYYYSITKLRLGYMPYHYVIDESGNVYKTGDDDVIQITDDPYLVIGYLSNNGQLSSKASIALLELTEDLSYTYGLEEYDICSYIVSETEDSFSELNLADANTFFVDSVNDTLEDWDGHRREHREYISEVINVEYEKSVEIGSNLKVKVTVQNNNNFIWTSDKYPIYIAVKDSQESIFAVNEVWDSFSKAGHVSSGIFVFPGESVELEFELQPKVVPGEYSETFEILKFDEEPFEDSEFTTEFTVEKGDQQVVMIDSPEYGYVNIRDCRWFSCEKIDIVNDGEVYPVVEYHESCWYKIKYGDGKEGWFYCHYAEEIE